VDNPPRNSCKKCAPRPSAGDSMVFTANLFDEANKRIGTLHGACAFTRGGRITGGAVGQCNLTVHLADGSMAVSALVNFGRKTIPFSVTGGTGAYEGARGSGTSTERGKGDISDDVVHLLP
jgi:allene oxide cyclase-like protein